MLKIAAFADEISPDLNEQIRVCKENGVQLFELRGVYGKNVLDFDKALLAEIKTKLEANGMGVVSIGSPIGKVAIDLPFQQHLDRFKTAVEAAMYFGARFIRVFSYYPPGGEGKGDISPHRDEVIDRFRKKVECIRDLPVTIIHENEKGIFGDIGSRCVDLMKSVESPQLRTAFDFANFVQCGQMPLDLWPALKPYTQHIHIKDSVAGTGKVVPAGEGDGKIAEILVDAWNSGYRGVLSLEPHLKVAGHSHGETGAALFKVAADALKKLCAANGIPLAKFG